MHALSVVYGCRADFRDEVGGRRICSSAIHLKREISRLYVYSASTEGYYEKIIPWKLNCPFVYNYEIFYDAKKLFIQDIYLCVKLLCWLIIDLI